MCTGVFVCAAKLEGNCSSDFPAALFGCLSLLSPWIHEFIMVLTIFVFFGSIYGKVIGRLFYPVDVVIDGLVFCFGW